MNKINPVLFGIYLTINILFVSSILYMSHNIPFYDDFDAIANFILEFKSATFTNKIFLIFEQYAEHRIAYTRFCAFLLYYFTGHLNFEYLILWGLLGLFGIQYILFKNLPQERNKILMLFPIVLIILNYQYWENLMSAMTSLQNLNVPFFILLFIYFLVFYSNLPYYKTLIFSVSFLAIFTSGNGLITLPLAICYFIQKRDYKNVFNWVIFSGIILFIYFYNYETPPSTFGGRSNVMMVLREPLLFAKNITAFTSSCFQAFALGNFNMNFIIGGILLTYMILYFFTILFKKNKLNIELFVMLSFGFLIATSILVSLNRAVSIDNMFISRYKIYSCLILALIYLSLLHNRHKLVKQITLAFFLCFAITFSYLSLPWIINLQHHFADLKSATITYHLNQKRWIGLYPPNTKYFSNATIASKITQELEAEGIYKVPFYKNIDSNKLDFTLSKANLCISNVNIVLKSEDTNNFILDNSDKPFAKNDENYAVLKSDKNKVFLTLRGNLQHNFLKNILLRRSLIDTGFSIIVPKINIDSGLYKLYLVYNENGKQHVCFVNEINIEKQITPYYSN